MQKSTEESFLVYDEPSICTTIVGGVPCRMLWQSPCENLADRPTDESADFLSIFARSASAVTPSEKKFNEH